MTPRIKKYLRILFWSHIITAASVPVFLLLAFLTRSWGVFRLGECTYRTFLHIYCPGCGGTRAVKALVRLDILGALSYSPVLFLFMAVVLWWDFWVVFAACRKQERFLKFSTPHIFWVVIAAGFLISILRSVLAYTVGYDPLGDLTASFFFGFI